MARLQEEYIKNIKPNLMKELGLKNIFSVPELKKVVINMGLGTDASDKKKLDSMKTMNYAELSAEVISEFTGKDLNKSEIFEIASKAYRNFVGDDAATLLELRNNKFILELFHGPTLAFKDFALQLLGGIFDKFLYDENKSITILGATSGDTGSAAIEAFKNKKMLDFLYCILRVE